MTRNFLQVAPLLLLCAAARADTVKLRNKPEFRHVRVTGFRDGKLVFRGVSQQYLRKPLADVEWLEIERLPALGDAERAAAIGRWNIATTRYETAQQLADDEWLQRFVRVRLLWAYDAAGRFDLAVELYIETLSLHPADLAQLVPTNPGPPGSHANRRARAALEAAASAPAAPGTLERARELLLQLLIYEEVTSLPFPPAPSDHLPPDPRAPADDPLGLLPPAPATSPSRNEAQSVILPADSFLLSAASHALDRGDLRRARYLVDAARPFVAADQTRPWQFIDARCQLGAGQFAAAAASLLDLAENDPDPGRSAAALYYVGLAHERMSRPDVARSCYEDVLRRPSSPPAIQADARAGLERLPR